MSIALGSRGAPPRSRDLVRVDHASRPVRRGYELAWRYTDPVAPFAAVREPSDEAFRALAPLIPPGGSVALFTPEEVHTSVLQISTRELVDRMIGPARGAPQRPENITELGAADAAEMVALVELTQPGPFKLRTRELGRFVGVRRGGELVAMAGERMHLTGYAEISGVCVHPDHQRQGYAADLVQTVSAGILARGETPMLHVRSENASAIALYEKVGFALRRRVHLAVLSA